MTTLAYAGENSKYVKYGDRSRQHWVSENGQRLSPVALAQGRVRAPVAVKELMDVAFCLHLCPSCRRGGGILLCLMSPLVQVDQDGGSMFSGCPSVCACVCVWGVFWPDCLWLLIKSVVSRITWNLWLNFCVLFITSRFLDRSRLSSYWQVVFTGQIRFVSIIPKHRNALYPTSGLAVLSSTTRTPDGRGIAPCMLTR